RPGNRETLKIDARTASQGERRRVEPCPITESTAQSRERGALHASSDRAGRKQCGNESRQHEGKRCGELPQPRSPAGFSSDPRAVRDDELLGAGSAHGYVALECFFSRTPEIAFEIACEGVFGRVRTQAGSPLEILWAGVV